MAITQKQLLSRVQKDFPEAEIEIVDLAGDGDHYELRIKCERFNNLSKVAQHQLVYKSLEGCVGTTLHALALKTEPKNGK